MFLDKILEFKKNEIKKLKKLKPLNISYDKDIYDKKNQDFKKAIISKKINIIAEIKKASPSKGPLNLDMNILDYAIGYEKSGAVAISVLTESNFFQGSSQDLIDIKNIVNIPVLRKDFIIDSYQIFESKLIGADAILLIADILDEKELKDFIIVSKYLKMEALIEVHELESLEKALKADAEIIGINNRCLKNFKVDINNTKLIEKNIPENIICISESGIFTKKDIEFLLSSKVKTFLIGEAITTNKHPFELIKSFMG